MASQQPEDSEGASHQEEAYTYEYDLSEDTTFNYYSQDDWSTLESLAEQGVDEFSAIYLGHMKTYDEPPLKIIYDSEVMQQANMELQGFHGRPFSEAETALYSIIQTVMEPFLRGQREADSAEERRARAEQQEEVTRQFDSMLEDARQWWPEGHGAQETLQQLRESISDINFPDVAEV
ncbi:hypothetical protein B9479_005474 [Cryptococcus floricola]|uniref:Uncharacterized protein n=1 Tax=Cryptococcus floricola TaxID=2591691 RepID=A0A5D3AQT9_9TREE|nr:hypothetical protein B9479_005474 [Cryptococcus floricola]